MGNRLKQSSPRDDMALCESTTFFLQFFFPNFAIVDVVVAIISRWNFRSDNFHGAHECQIQIYLFVLLLLFFFYILSFAVYPSEVAVTSLLSFCLSSSLGRAITTKWKMKIRRRKKHSGDQWYIRYMAAFFYCEKKIHFLGDDLHGFFFSTVSLLLIFQLLSLFAHTCSSHSNFVLRQFWPEFLRFDHVNVFFHSIFASPHFIFIPSVGAFPFHSFRLLLPSFSSPYILHDGAPILIVFLLLSRISK